MNKHTSTPWTYQGEMTTGFGVAKRMDFQIYTSSGKYGHPATCDKEEDAAYIVKAVNCHELALQLAKAVIRADQEGSLKAYMLLNMAKDFLAKAEESL